MMPTADTVKSLTDEERTCSDCGKPNQHEIAKTGSALQRSWRGEELYLCQTCREAGEQGARKNRILERAALDASIYVAGRDSAAKRECPSCDVEMSFYCSHCQQEFEQ